MRIFHRINEMLTNQKDTVYVYRSSRNVIEKQKEDEKKKQTNSNDK